MKNFKNGATNMLTALKSIDFFLTMVGLFPSLTRPPAPGCKSHFRNATSDSLLVDDRVVGVVVLQSLGPVLRYVFRR